MKTTLYLLLAIGLFVALPVAAADGIALPSLDDDEKICIDVDIYSSAIVQIYRCPAMT